MHKNFSLKLSAVLLWILLSATICSTSGFLCDECECTVFNSKGHISMNCAGRNFTEVPEFLRSSNYTNVTQLFLDNNNISRLPTRGFEGLPNLRVLHLSHNGLSHIDNHSLPNLTFGLLNLGFNNLDESSFDEMAFEDMRVRGTLDMSFNRLPYPPKSLINVPTISLILHHNPMNVIKTNAFKGYSDEIATIDLSDCNLTYIQPYAFDKNHFGLLDSLYLDNNNFVELNSSFFQGAYIQTKLSLQNCGIQVMRNKTFTALVHVDLLYLNYNNFTRPIHRNPFKFFSVGVLEMKQSNIQWITKGFFRVRVDSRLDLSGNNISILQAESFKGLEGVRVLVLSGCNIAEMRGQPFSVLPDLQRLYLDHNLLTNDNLQFLNGSSKKMYLLDITQNRFQLLPNLSSLTNLHDLYASNNDIRSIGRDAFLDTRLENIQLSGNHDLADIHEDALAHLMDLTAIDVSFSSLRRLPSLSNLQNLIDINAVESNLQELPADLCTYSTKLEQLLVDRNEISSIPDLQNCSNLYIVFLDFNRITSVGERTFQGLEHLITIQLQHNRITEIHPNAFSDLSNLYSLHLAHNSISSLPPSFFDGLTNIGTLDLQDNLLTSLPKDIFKDQIYLQRLYINDNRINSVGNPIFPPNVTWLQELNISNNTGLSSFPLPESGFPFLHTLAMSNLPKLYDVPTLSQIPRIQFINVTYAYHCCLFKRHIPEELLVSIKLNTKTVTMTHTPTNNTDFTVNEETDEILFEVHRPTSEPLTLPPHIIDGHLFPDRQDPYNPSDHNIPSEELEEVLRSFLDQTNVSIRIGPNEQIDFVDDDGNVVGNANEETLKLVTRALQQFNINVEIVCYPLPNPLMPCENLLDPTVLRVLVWLLWFPAILGNLAVIFVTLASGEKVDVPNFMICNLAVADFLLGVYLAFLGIVDIRTYGDSSYYKSALYWLKGPGCRTAGFIAIFSSELSVFMLVVVTLERLHTIVYSFRHGARVKMRQAILFVAAGWIFAATMAMTPLLDINSYAEVPICLPFRTEFVRDRIYVGILLSINVVAFLAIFFSYLHILVVFCKSPAADRKVQERLLTSFKMGVLVITNLICWLPLTVVGLAAVAEVYIIDFRTAKYFIILVFPINACLNPFLYAIFTKHFWQKCRSLCKRTDKTIQSVTPSTRLSFRRNSVVSCSDTCSVNRNQSPQDIDHEMLKKRQSRRSFSLQLDPNILPPQPVMPVVPYLGRRNSSPAVFGLDSGGRASMGIRLPLDQSLDEEQQTRTPPGELQRTRSNCLSIVHEESSLFGSDDEEDIVYSTNTTGRGVTTLCDLHRSSSDPELNLQRRSIRDLMCRNDMVGDTEMELVDTLSNCSSESEDFEDARTSPCVDTDHNYYTSSHHHISFIHTLPIDSNHSDSNHSDSNHSDLIIHRLSSSTTDSVSVIPKGSSIIKINPHATKLSGKCQEETFV